MTSPTKSLNHHQSQVHGDAVAERPLLRDAARRLLGRLKPVWGRLDGLLQDVRCMVGYFGNLQG